VRLLQWGLNASLNETTGKTPHELLLGYQPRQANDSFLRAEVCDTLRDENRLDTRRQTSKRIRTKQAQQNTRYDRRRKPTPVYCEGQQVLIRKVVPANDGKSNKLLQNFGL
jgi:hypothetical protein